MNIHFEIIAEDQAIAEVVSIFGYKNPNLAGNIGQVFNLIEKHYKGKLAIGIIDDDKKKPKLFDLYSEVKSESSLVLMRKANTTQYVIVLQPASEEWIFQNAVSQKVPSNFSSFKDLKRVSKELLIKKNQTVFKQFLNAIYQSEAPGFITLKEWIDDLYEKHHF